MPAAKGSTALTKAKTELTKYRGKLTAVRRDAKQSEVPNALMGAGAVLGGAAGCGAVRAMVGDEFMGVPVDVALGLIIGGVSIGWGSPIGVYVAAGALAPYVGDATKDALENMGMGGAAGGYLPGMAFEEDVDFVEVEEPQFADTFASNFG